MNSLLPVFLSSLAFSAFFLLYCLLLRKHSWFQLNRFFLLGIMLLSFSMPFIQWPGEVPVVPQTLEWWTETTLFVEKIPLATDQTPVQEMRFGAQPLSPATIDWSQLALLIYGAGIGWMFLLFGMKLLALKRLTQRAYAHRPSVKHLPALSHSFTFLRTIYLGQDFQGLSSHKRHMFLQHEDIHRRQWHSLDLLFAELCQIVFWFNPLVYRWKKDLQLQHEYLADKAVVKHNGRSTYGHLLLELCKTRPNRDLVHSFAQISIQNRINMMVQSPSQRRQLWRYTIILPVALLCVFGFSCVVPETTATHLLNETSVEKAATMLRPVDGLLNEGFGQKNPDARMHRGLDFIAPTGMPVYAANDGAVMLREMTEGYGNQIVLQHTDELKSRYAHLDAFAIEMGEKVKRGQLIGFVGNTGKSTYPHLHFEVLEAGKAVDPLPYFDDISARIIRGNAWPSIQPLSQTEITSGFGMRMHPVHKERRMHVGVDFRAEIGTPVYAAANGTVSLSKQEGGHGLHVIVNHENGYETKYANLSKSIVRVGQNIRQGEIIAYTGNTGLSTAPHLHFEVRFEEKPVNPALYFLQDMSKDDYRKLKNQAKTTQD